MTRRLLDVGCGDGATAVDRGWPYKYEYHGVDIDAECVAAARSKGLNVTRSDVTTGLNYADGMFDRVVCKAIVEHVATPLQLLGECFRVLEPGGFVDVTVPSDRSYDVWGDYTHKRAFRRDALEDILTDAGFTEVRVTPWHPVDSVGMLAKSLYRVLAPWTPYGYPRAWTAAAIKDANTGGEGRYED